MVSKLKVFILLAVIALVAFVAFKDNYDFQNFSQNKSFTIKITSGGFEPKEITIPINSKIIFTNENSEPSWPASNYHPSHDLYPEFDIKRPLEPGKNWTFQFKQTGSWGFHDHLDPRFTGKIIVADGSSSKKIPDPVKRLNLPKNEVTNKVNEVAKTKGALAAWQFFKETYSNNNPEGSHDIAHYIGSLVYKELGLNGIKECDTSFSFGCYHGVLEELIAEDGIGDLAKVIEVCKTIPLQSQITCYHGLGHGILPFFKYDLKPSLSLCDSILPSEHQVYCYNGVFMENAIVNFSKVTKDNPQWPCNTVDEKYKSACWGYQMVFLFNLYNNNITKIAEICSEAGKDDYTKNCIRGLSQQITQTSSYESNTIRGECAEISGDMANFCQIAAAEEWVFQRQSYDIAKADLCETLPSPWSKECLEKIAVQKSIQ